MAAQCGLNGGPASLQQAQQQPQQRTFVSSSAYYGYVPVRLPEAHPEAPADMEVDRVPELRCLGPRKRGFAPDELAAYVPRFKRFREGETGRPLYPRVRARPRKPPCSASL